MATQIFAAVVESQIVRNGLISQDIAKQSVVFADMLIEALNRV